MRAILFLCLCYMGTSRGSSMTGRLLKHAGEHTQQDFGNTCTNGNVFTWGSHAGDATANGQHTEFPLGNLVDGNGGVRWDTTVTSLETRNAYLEAKDPYGDGWACINLKATRQVKYIYVHAVRDYVIGDNGHVYVKPTLPGTTSGVVATNNHDGRFDDTEDTECTVEFDSTDVVSKHWTYNCSDAVGQYICVENDGQPNTDSDTILHEMAACLGSPAPVDYCANDGGATNYDVQVHYDAGPVSEGSLIHDLVFHEHVLPNYPRVPVADATNVCSDVEPGNFCSDIEGEFRNNINKRLPDPQPTAFKYNATTLIFGKCEGGYFKMVSTDMRGVMQEARYTDRYSGCAPLDTDFVFEAQNLQGIVIKGDTTCIGTSYCAQDVVKLYKHHTHDRRLRHNDDGTHKPLWAQKPTTPQPGDHWQVKDATTGKAMYYFVPEPPLSNSSAQQHMANSGYCKDAPTVVSPARRLRHVDPFQDFETHSDDFTCGPGYVAIDSPTDWVDSSSFGMDASHVGQRDDTKAIDGKQGYPTMHHASSGAWACFKTADTKVRVEKVFVHARTGTTHDDPSHLPTTAYVASPILPDDGVALQTTFDSNTPRTACEVSSSSGSDPEHRTFTCPAEAIGTHVCVEKTDAALIVEEIGACVKPNTYSCEASHQVYVDEGDTTGTLVAAASGEPVLAPLTCANMPAPEDYCANDGGGTYTVQVHYDAYVAGTRRPDLEFHEHVLPYYKHQTASHRHGMTALELKANWHVHAQFDTDGWYNKTIKNALEYTADNWLVCTQASEASVYYQMIKVHWNRYTGIFTTLARQDGKTTCDDMVVEHATSLVWDTSKLYGYRVTPNTGNDAHLVGNRRLRHNADGTHAPLWAYDHSAHAQPGDHWQVKDAEMLTYMVISDSDSCENHGNYRDVTATECSEYANDNGIDYESRSWPKIASGCILNQPPGGTHPIYVWHNSHQNGDDSQNHGRLCAKSPSVRYYFVPYGDEDAAQHMANSGYCKDAPTARRLRHGSNTPTDNHASMTGHFEDGEPFTCAAGYPVVAGTRWNATNSFSNDLYDAVTNPGATTRGHGSAIKDEVVPNTHGHQLVLNEGGYSCFAFASGMSVVNSFHIHGMTMQYAYRMPDVVYVKDFSDPTDLANAKISLDLTGLTGQCTLTAPTAPTPLHDTWDCNNALGTHVCIRMKEEYEDPQRSNLVHIQEVAACAAAFYSCEASHQVYVDAANALVSFADNGSVDIGACVAPTASPTASPTSSSPTASPTASPSLPTMVAAMALTPEPPMPNTGGGGSIAGSNSENIRNALMIIGGAVLTVWTCFEVCGAKRRNSQASSDRDKSSLRLTHPQYHVMYKGMDATKQV